MNKCMELDLQEMLPDLLHRTLDSAARARVEAHVARCAACSEELKVLRTVASAAVFAPTIDVHRIVGHIAPYKSIAPVVQPPARSRVVSWLVAASMLVVIAGGGSLLMVQQRQTGTRVAPNAVASQQVPTPSQSAAVKAPVTSAPGAQTLDQPTHTFALAAGVDGLSDGDLRQLMNDMDSFDALPTVEPEPVLSVDNGDNLDQGF